MTTTAPTLGPFDLERVFRAVDKITERLNRAAAALDAAGVPYAVIGGNAVANWVSRVDESMTRFTKDVDILLRSSDLDAAEAALVPVGFIRRTTLGITAFLDGPNSKFGDAVHVIVAGRKVRSEYLLPAPDVEERERGPDYYVLKLDALVRMKLTSNRDHDRTHIRDLMKVGLVDESWLTRVPPELVERLQYCLDTPDG
ncbi:MAG: hypothetical protein AABP62_18845 [Planctomycetota bacterium]